MPPTVVSSVLVAGAGAGAGGGAGGAPLLGAPPAAACIEPGGAAGGAATEAGAAASGSSTPGVAAFARTASVQATAETRTRSCALMRLFLFIGRFSTGGTYRARSKGVRVIPPGLHCVGWVMPQRCATSRRAGF